MKHIIIIVLVILSYSDKDVEANWKNTFNWKEEEASLSLCNPRERYHHLGRAHNSNDKLTMFILESTKNAVNETITMSTNKSLQYITCS